MSFFSKKHNFSFKTWKLERSSWVIFLEVSKTFLNLLNRDSLIYIRSSLSVSSCVQTTCIGWFCCPNIFVPCSAFWYCLQTRRDVVSFFGIPFPSESSFLNAYRVSGGYAVAFCAYYYNLSLPGLESTWLMKNICLWDNVEKLFSSQASPRIPWVAFRPYGHLSHFRLQVLEKEGGYSWLCPSYDSQTSKTGLVLCA